MRIATYVSIPLTPAVEKEDSEATDSILVSDIKCI